MAWQQKYDFDEIIPLSAKDQENLDEVLATIKNYLPDGPAMYPDEMKTDHDENFRICEVIREKILNKTEEEIPHSIAVVLEKRRFGTGRRLSTRSSLWTGTRKRHFDWQARLDDQGDPNRVAA